MTTPSDGDVEAGDRSTTRLLGLAGLAVVSLLAAVLAAATGVAQADPLPVTFGPPTDYGTGNAPASVVTGDLNGDTALDLVVVNYSSSTVTVLLGDGTGVFSDRTDYSTGTDPYAVALGDLNGDTHLDMIVTNYQGYSVSIRLGDGSGRFGDRSDVAVGGSPYSVAVADLDGDTFADLAVANANDVSVLFGDGAGGFGGLTAYPTGAYAASVAIGDLDGDAAPDLVVANYAADDASVLLNDGDGTFGPKQDVSTGVGPYSLALGDLNGDTQLDLVATSFASGSVSVRLGDGLGGFGARTDHPTGSGAIFVAVGDLNGDPFLDVGVASFGSSTVSLLLGDGTGDLGPSTEVPALAARSLALGDLDGNGLDDLVVANYYAASSVSVRLNAGPSCPALAAAPHTSLSLSNGSQEGSVATFVADPGFVLVGSGTVTCQAGYTWDGVAPSAQSTGAIASAPAAGPLGGDEVDLLLSGFAPGAHLEWGQCLEAEPASEAPCAGGGGRGVADSSGSLIATLRVDRFVYVPGDARWVDCADPTEHCAVGAADEGDVPATRVLAPSGFGPVPAPPAIRGTIALSPPGPVPQPGSTVTVTGSAFRPGAVVDLYQCAPAPGHPSDCNLRVGSVVADGTGGFTTPAVVVARVTPPGGSTIDCFAASGVCTIAAAEAVDFPGTVTAAAITVPPRIVPGPVAIKLEGDAGTRVVNVKVGLSEPSTQTVTVDWTTFDSTTMPWAVAQSGVDYVAASGTVTFTPGQTAQTVPVTINGDVSYEADEAVPVRFSNPTNAALVPGLLGAIGWANIANDDPIPPPPPAVVTGPVAIRLEGNSGTRVVGVRVSLSAPTTQAVTVDWATTPSWGVGSATPGVDYLAASGTVTFAPGQTARTVLITILGDTIVEPGELLAVRFSNATNATLAAGLGRVGFAHIANDD